MYAPGSFAAARIPGDEEGREAIGVDPRHAGFGQGVVEVHEQEAFDGLGDAVHGTGCNPEFLGLGFERQGGQA